MDVTSLATSYAGMQQARVQMAAAAAMMRMTMQADASILKVIEAAQETMQSAANNAAGIGGHLDISV
jgi:hypothetical protein